MAVRGMRHARGLDPQVADLDLGRQRFDVQARGREARLVMERIESPVDAIGGDHAHVARRIELPAEVMTQRHEIDEVIRMEVADQDRVDRARLDRRREPGEGPLTEVEDDGRRARTDQV